MGAVGEEGPLDARLLGLLSDLSSSESDGDETSKKLDFRIHLNAVPPVPILQQQLQEQFQQLHRRLYFSPTAVIK